MILIRPIESMVVDEDFDTERVIVDLRSGRYFCVNESGSWLWQALGRGPVSVAALAGLLAKNQSAPQEEITAAIESWAATLQRGLLLELDPSDATAAAPLDAGELPPEWPVPTVTVYGDLEHLLALDPIHEVDEAAGWPQEKAGADSEAKA
jgi:hypothetical protein